MGRIGAQLLNQTKEDNQGDKSSSRKDILSLLVRANSMQDLPEAQRMKDEDVMARAYKLGLNWYIAQYTCRNSYFPHSWSRNNKVRTSAPQTC